MIDESTAESGAGQCSEKPALRSRDGAVSER